MQNLTKHISSLCAIAAVSLLIAAADYRTAQPPTETDLRIDALNSLYGEIAGIEREVMALNSKIMSLDTDLDTFADTLGQLTDNLISINRQSVGMLRKSRKLRRGCSSLNAYIAPRHTMRELRAYNYLDSRLTYNRHLLQQMHDNYFAVERHRDNIIDLVRNESVLYVMLDDAFEVLDYKRSQAFNLTTLLLKDKRSYTRVMERRRDNTLRLDRIVTRSVDPGAGGSVAPERERSLTTEFEAGRGNHLFPVSGTYNIVGYFGESRHPNMPRVVIDNPGIDIETKSGAKARAIYNGEVSGIFQIPGYHTVVMVRHGAYITVYGNLRRASVKKGEKVKAGQTLGTIYSEKSDKQRTILHFEVRKEQQKLNPLDWVKR